MQVVPETRRLSKMSEVSENNYKYCLNKCPQSFPFMKNIYI